MNKNPSGQACGPRALIRELLANPMSAQQIEARSFQIIDREMGKHPFSPEEWEIVRRMVHTSADLEITGQVRFSGDAIDAAVAALVEGRPIFADSNMIRSGISLARLRGVCSGYGPASLFCHVADEDVAREAIERGLPRSLFAVRKARSMLHRGIALFGNAPVALLELNRLVLEDGILPAVVIGMPVGFVHVTESKEELMSLGVPYVVLAGRRGGSPLAVSVLHALCSVAMGRGRDPQGAGCGPGDGASR